MKPIYLEKNTQLGDQSFFFRYAEIPHTYDKFHFHKEFELLYNIKNSGTRFLGDSVNRFEDGDLVLVGPNIPHYWHSDDKYFKDDPGMKAKVVLIQFARDFLGEKFLGLPEMLQIESLYEKAEQGIQIRGKEAEYIGSKLIELNKMSGWKRLVQFIEILCLMADVSDYKLLASRSFCLANKFGNNQKISDIFNFIIKNYQEEIELKELASMANMNMSAFCRYFKKSTSKTFTEVLNEIRIGFACKKLINTDDLVSQIGYSCGYTSISYFNRKFRKIKSLTPEAYREVHRKEIVL